MYRINYSADKCEDGVGCHRVGWQEVPWLWLAKLKIKKWIREDGKIFRAYIEDISDKYWDKERREGKTVFEWERK